MLPPTTPLEPKDPRRPLQVLIIGRISTEHQNEENINASYRYVESYLERLYQGPIEIRHLGERASGMLVDRATIRQAEDLIATGHWDLVIAEDLSRIFRNPRHQYNFVQDAVDAETRLICIADNLDTADENWEIMLGAATLRHGMTVPDVRRRVRRTATHAFHRGGMVLKVKYGYRKLSEEEAASGEFGPPGLRIAKRPECTAILREMKDRVLRGDHYEAIAEWLRDEGVENPPYAREWSAKLVKTLLCDPILSGTRRFRNVIHRPVYRTGKHRRIRNVEPEEKHYPELAHFSPDEHEELIRVIRDREQKHRQRSGRDHPRSGQPRSRAIWPAQHARCAVCGGLMYQIGESLKCQNALGKGRIRCWNRVQVRTSIARHQVLAALIEIAEQTPELMQLLLESITAERDHLYAKNHRAVHLIDREITERQRQAGNLSAAIAQGGRMEVLLERLAAVHRELQFLEEQRRQEASRPTNDEPTNFESSLFSIAETSFAFADFLRDLIPQFLIQPVQALDTPQVRPQAKLTIEFPSSAGAEPERCKLDHEFTVNLFEPPLHIQFVDACSTAKREAPNCSLKTIAQRLDLNHMTVKRALDYGRRMERAGLSDPYRKLTQKPNEASRWKRRKE